MDRGSIEISTFEPTPAPGALVPPDRPGRNLKTQPCTFAPQTAASATPSRNPDSSRESDSRASRSLSASPAVVPEHSAEHAENRRRTNGTPIFLPRYSSRGGFSRRRLATAAIAACLTVALHALLITSLLWSAGSPDHRPDDAGALDSFAPEAADDGALKVVLIQDASDAPPAAFAGGGAPLSTVRTIVALPNADPLSDMRFSLPEISVDSPSSVSTPAPDTAARSAMYGRYVGQIDARIERAWQRPRTAIGAPFFTCLVRVDQDSRGTVLEITLEHCNGSERWQRSLVRAIESASPLPGPPDPAIFTRILHLSFQSQPYSQAAPQDAYEPVPSAQQLARAETVEDQTNEPSLPSAGH